MMEFLHNHISAILIIFRVLEGLRIVWCSHIIICSLKSDDECPGDVWFYTIANIIFSATSFVLSFFVEIKELLVMTCCHFLILIFKIIIAVVLERIHEKQKMRFAWKVSFILDCWLTKYYEDSFGEIPKFSEFDFEQNISSDCECYCLSACIGDNRAAYYDAVLKTLIEKKDIGHFLKKKEQASDD